MCVLSSLQDTRSRGVTHSLVSPPSPLPSRTCGPALQPRARVPRSAGPLLLMPALPQTKTLPPTLT